MTRIARMKPSRSTADDADATDQVTNHHSFLCPYLRIPRNPRFIFLRIMLCLTRQQRQLPHNDMLFAFRFFSRRRSVLPCRNCWH